MKKKRLLFVDCFTSQQHAGVSQRRSSPDNCTCCHTEKEVADQPFHLIQSQYTDTGPTSPSTDPLTPGAWQGSQWSAIVFSRWCDSTQKNPHGESGNRTPGSSALEADVLTTWPTRQWRRWGEITTRTTTVPPQQLQHTERGHGRQSPC